MKTVRRILFYATITAVVLLVALVSSVLLFKDKIIEQFIREANKSLNTPVKVGKFEVSVFQEFPNISVVLHEVYVEDSHEGIYPLFTADKVSFQMNPIQVWNGDYTIKGIAVDNSETSLKINTRGEGNYIILKPSQGTTSGSVKFELKDIELNNSKVHYRDITNRQDLKFSSESLRATIQSTDNTYNINAEGQLVTEQILIDGLSYLEGKTFLAKSDLIYDDVRKNLIIKPTTLQLKQASFNVQGSYSWKERNVIDLVTTGNNTDIQTLISLLPGSVARDLEKYKSDGDVYFNAKLKGEISQRKDPALTIEFGFNDATIFHPEFKTRIEHANMTGSFASTAITDMRTASLVLKNIKGTFNEEKFDANFIISNFENAQVILDFKGKLDAASVLGFYPVADIKEVSGSIIADIAFEGKLELLKNRATAQRVSTLGTIDLQNINLTYGKDNVALRSLNGSLQFNNNDLALSNVAGKIGHSDFLLNGFFKNIITFVLFENQPIGIETDLQADHIDLDELFTLIFSSESTGPEYTFAISHNVNLNFNCDVQTLNYKKFRAQKVKGDLLVKNKIAVSRNLSFQTMGGGVELSGIVDATNPKAIDVITTLKVANVQVDSAFYVFENFQQSFIEHRHLKGSATAEVNMEMTLNPNLKLFQETLIADIGVTIKNGELNNFEPLQSLKRYVDDEGLNRLRFSDLHNDIRIEKKTVFIPPMDIRSNVTDLKVSGTHTFDQRIDYRVVTPLRRKKITDVDAQNAIEQTSEGAKLFLKITGTTDDYKVAYDGEAVRKKIVSDIKKEVKEFKEILNFKKKEKEVELNKDDYFEDW